MFSFYNLIKLLIVITALVCDILKHKTYNLLLNSFGFQYCGNFIFYDLTDTIDAFKHNIITLQANSTKNETSKR